MVTIRKLFILSIGFLVIIRMTNVDINDTSINEIVKQSKSSLYVARVQVCVRPSIIPENIITSTQSILLVISCCRIYCNHRKIIYYPTMKCITVICESFMKVIEN